MKLSFITVAVLAAPLAVSVMAAPAAGDNNDKHEFDGNSKCEVHGFKYSPPRIVECCLKNTGGSDQQPNHVKCTLPIGREGWFRKCIKDLGFATVVDCEYYDDEDQP